MSGRVLLLGFCVLLAAGVCANAATVFSVNGNSAAVTAEADNFRTALGGALNAPGACSPTPCTSGRREINWDAVGAGFFDPFPGAFFNNDGTVTGRTRGLSMTSPGTMAVSNTGFGFGDFPSFSADRIFAVKDSSELNVFFHVPGQPTTNALVRGMGIIFIDAEFSGSTMEFFDVGDSSLGSYAVPIGASASFSFLGVVFDSPVVARVKVTAGDNGIFNASTDAVAMDDFIYGEPQLVPEPSTAALGACGALLLGLLRRSSQRRR